MSNPSGYIKSEKKSNLFELVDAEARSKMHEHSNKTVLDSITESDIENWNSDEGYINVALDDNGDVHITGSGSSAPSCASEVWEKIVDVTLEESVGCIDVVFDEPFTIKKAYMIMQFSGGARTLSGNTALCWRFNKASGTLLSYGCFANPLGMPNSVVANRINTISIPMITEDGCSFFTVDNVNPPSDNSQMQSGNIYNTHVQRTITSDTLIESIRINRQNGQAGDFLAGDWFKVYVVKGGV